MPDETTKKPAEEMKVRYTANYTGESGLLHTVVHPGDVLVVKADIAKLLISSGQFEPVVETKPTEVTSIGKVARNSG